MTWCFMLIGDGCMIWSGALYDFCYGHIKTTLTQLIRTGLYCKSFRDWCKNLRILPYISQKKSLVKWKKFRDWLEQFWGSNENGSKVKHVTKVQKFQADADWFRQHLTKRHDYRVANAQTDDEKQTPNVPESIKKSIKKVEFVLWDFCMKLYVLTLRIVNISNTNVIE